MKRTISLFLIIFVFAAMLFSCSNAQQESSAAESVDSEISVAESGDTESSAAGSAEEESTADGYANEFTENGIVYKRALDNAFIAHGESGYWLWNSADAKPAIGNGPPKVFCEEPELVDKVFFCKVNDYYYEFCNVDSFEVKDYPGYPLFGKSSHAIVFEGKRKGDLGKMITISGNELIAEDVIFSDTIGYDFLKLGIDKNGVKQRYGVRLVDGEYVTEKLEPHLVWQSGDIIGNSGPHLLSAEVYAQDVFESLYGTEYRLDLLCDGRIEKSVYFSGYHDKYSFESCYHGHGVSIFVNSHKGKALYMLNDRNDSIVEIELPSDAYVELPPDLTTSYVIVNTIYGGNPDILAWDYGQKCRADIYSCTGEKVYSTSDTEDIRIEFNRADPNWDSVVIIKDRKYATVRNLNDIIEKH